MCMYICLNTHTAFLMAMHKSTEKIIIIYKPGISLFLLKIKEHMHFIFTIIESLAYHKIGKSNIFLHFLTQIS